MLSLSTLAAVVLAAFVSGLGIGYGAAHQQISLLNDAIDLQGRLAQEKLDAAEQRVTESQAKAEAINNELDKSIEAHINDVNYYDQQRDSVRLFATHRNDCGSPASGSHQAEVSGAAAAAEAALDEEINRVIREAAAITEQSEIYAWGAYEFATVNNCGIER